MAERITGHTELIGLMAYPIRHSSSPAMHNEAFATLGLDYAYLAFEVDNSTLEDAVKGLRALKMVGSNVSMPNKTVVGQYLDELSPAAKMAGAVNTIVNDNGKLIGHITDGIGFMAALKDNNIDAIGKKMTIVGAGGAATAIEIQDEHRDQIRIVQETVAGKEITFAHIMGGPAPIIYQKLGLNPQVDYGSSAIGIMNMTPSESAVIASDIAVKSGNVYLGFADRFTGTLIITGEISDVQTAMEEIVDYFRDTLGYVVCKITKR